MMLASSAAASADTTFITSQTLGTLRSNYDGCVGMKITVGGSSITVTQLGRWVVSGNSATHTLKILASDGTVVVSANINTSGLTAAQFNYVVITSTVLSASTSYYIVSTEANGGDQWYNNDTAITHTAAATVPNSAHVATVCNSSGDTPVDDTGTDLAYVPMSFKYH